MLDGDSGINGTIYFRESWKGPVTITGELANLVPLSKRGFHVQYVPRQLP